MSQPSWHCIANLGDVNPLEHGGDFVMVDKRGCYTPELWHWEPDTSKMYEVTLERCVCPGYSEQVFDNRHYPDKPAWFGTKSNLESAAGTCGMNVIYLRSLLCDSNPVQRAQGYLVLCSNFGFFEFDSSPRQLEGPHAAGLCRVLLHHIKMAECWKDGI